MPCIRFKSQARTHTKKGRETEGLTFKKNVFPSAPEPSEEAPGWGEGGCRGGGQSAEWILRLFAAQRKYSFKRKKEKQTVKLMVVKEEQLI